MSDIVSFLAIFVVTTACLSLIVVQLLTGVPSLSLSASEAADAIALLKDANLPQRAVIYELGSGWGALVIALARAFPNAEVRGIEISPLPYLVARFRTRKMPNVSLIWGDFNKRDLADADAVTCYLMRNPMVKLANLLDGMLKPGTRVVSVAFWFRGRQVAATRQGRMRGAVALYHWPAIKPDWRYND
ncbi:class I SAM-dependent methyltransferase [Paraburkholderia phenazinium]|jgi:tRNA A58 N-methylase Trm61|uniref:Methyltransferase domain-containing protein n=1 Tax=Paraburkholderia phenazinium TaxID=60549 RepID=A0A1G8AUC6_9BURK|nr:class I SAM-dependent methyltransferase [Paraburkholderia phenazinium]SDH24376.1 Methyltransferase domain-containing protein [Paraburkholderia phenazinium]